MNPVARGAIEMIVAMTLLGTIGWFVVMSGAPASQVVFWRCVFASVVLGGACLASGHSPLRLRGRQLWLALGSGIAIVSNWLLLFEAFPRAGIALSTILYSTQPFMLVFFGWLVFAETLTPARVGWIGLGFVGLVLVAANGLTSAVGTNVLLGMALAIGAALLWALAALQTKLLSDVPPHLIAFVHMLVGIVMLAPVGLNSLDVSWPTGWAMLATIGVVHTGFVYILMYSAIHRLPTYLQGPLSYIYPVVAVLVDIVAFGHRLTWLEAAGVTTILIAVMARRDPRHGKNLSPTAEMSRGSAQASRPG